MNSAQRLSLSLFASIALVIVGLSPRTVEAQRYYLKCVPQDVDAWPNHDTPFRIVIAVGGYIGSQFRPDDGSHSYQFVSGESALITITSPKSASFQGFDTLWGNYHASLSTPPGTFLHFLIDNKHEDSCEVDGHRITKFKPLQVAWSDSILTPGANVVRNIMIGSSNPSLVTIVSATLTGDPAISIVPGTLDLPQFVKMSNGPSVRLMQLHIAPSSSTHFIESKLTIVSQWAEDSLDTTTYTRGWYFVDPAIGDCIDTRDLDIADATPFGYQSVKGIFMHNPEPKPVTVTRMWLDTSTHTSWARFLQLDTSMLPLTIASDDSALIPLAITIPAGALDFRSVYGSIYVNYAITSHDSDGVVCPQVRSTVTMEPFWPYGDTLAIPLFTATNTSIDFYLGDVVFPAVGRMLRFINDSHDDVTIVGKRLIDDTIAYSIPYWGFSRDTVLHSNETFLACIEWQWELGRSRPTSNHIVLYFADSTQTRAIPIQLHFGAVSANEQSPVRSKLSPNPSSTSPMLHIEGFLRASVQVVDALGRVVQNLGESRGPECSMQIPSGSMTAGSYFVRIAGEDTNGNGFVQSLPMVRLR